LNAPSTCQYIFITILFFRAVDLEHLDDGTVDSNLMFLSTIINSCVEAFHNTLCITLVSQHKGLPIVCLYRRSKVTQVNFLKYRVSSTIRIHNILFVKLLKILNSYRTLFNKNNNNIDHYWYIFSHFVLFWRFRMPADIAVMDEFDSNSQSTTHDLSEIQSFYNGTTVFLTGATGFVGNLILEKLIR